MTTIRRGDKAQAAKEEEKQGQGKEAISFAGEGRVAPAEHGECGPPD